MNPNARKTWLGTLCLAFILAGTAMPARSADQADATCPANYSAMGSICLNASTGDVVNQSPITQGMSPASASCQAGYELIQSVCISLTTGDVVLTQPASLPK